MSQGPPSAQKINPSASIPSVESSYELMLKQQQLLLQLELEWQQKYPHMIIPAATHQVNVIPTRLVFYLN